MLSALAGDACVYVLSCVCAGAGVVSCVVCRLLLLAFWLLALAFVDALSCISCCLCSLALRPLCPYILHPPLSRSLYITPSILVSVYITMRISMSLRLSSFFPRCLDVLESRHPALHTPNFMYLYESPPSHIHRLFPSSPLHVHLYVVSSYDAGMPFTKDPL